jgi:hypothetical protein
MWIKLRCKGCDEMLSGKNSYDVDPINGTSITRPWYTDETGLNHMAVACLKCGTIHDIIPSIIKIFIGRPYKVYNTINVRDESFLREYKGKSPEAFRKVQLRNIMISRDIIDAMVERHILGIDSS